MTSAVAFDWAPRSVAVFCAVGAVFLGLVYLATAGAPVQYLAVNAGTLVAGLILVAAWAKWTPPTLRQPGPAVLLIGIAMIVTAWLGNSVEGTTRWVLIGPVILQPGLVLLPLVLVLFADNRSSLSSAGIMVAAAGLMQQPDRAMAGVMMAGLAALALSERDRLVLSALVLSTVAFAATLLKPDTLPAQPYVEQVLHSAFQTHWLAGLAVWFGAALLIVPAIYGWVRDPEHRATYAVFGAVWLGVVSASALGNYPTPLVGYGASSILGYVLSLAALPRWQHDA